MLKLLIIDDDAMIREGIKNAIPWKEHGIVEVRTAENGDIGEQVFNELLPDIVLTDIRMPGIDGLELLQRIKKTRVDVKVIILSGFDEFSYVQTALKLGAFDYLLKTADIHELLKVINKAKEELLKEKLETEKYLKIKQQLNLSLPLLKYRYLDELIYGYDDLERMYKKMDFVDLKIPTSSLFVSVIEIDDFLLMTENKTEEDRLLLKFRIFNIIEELFGNNGVCFETKNEEFVCIYFCTPELTELEGITHFTALLEKISESVHKIAKTSISIGYSSSGNDISSIKACFEEAKKALEHKLLLGKGSIIHINDIASYTNISYKLDSDSENKLMSSLRVGDKIAVNKVIEKVLDDVEHSKNVEVSSFRIICIELFGIASRILCEFDIDMRVIFGKNFLYFDEVKKYETLQDTRKWMLSNFQMLTDYILNTKILKAKRIIETAKGYIDKHFNEEISLNQISEMVHLSPNYFSSIFSVSMGQSFLEYIIDRRIEKAKQLLGEKDSRSYEVGEKVGYDNPYYFSRIFKKYTNMTPSEYKDSLK